MSVATGDRPRYAAPTRVEVTESQGESLALQRGDESDMTHSQPLDNDSL